MRIFEALIVLLVIIAITGAITLIALLIVWLRGGKYNGDVDHSPH